MNTIYEPLPPPAMPARGPGPKFQSWLTNPLGDPEIYFVRSDDFFNGSTFLAPTSPHMRARVSDKKF